MCLSATNFLNTFATWCRNQKLMNARAAANVMYIPTEYEHWANTYSHAIMIVPSILGNEYLLWNTWKIYVNHRSYDREHYFSVAKNNTLSSYATYEFCSRAYGASLILLFVVSSLFHWLSWTQSHWKKQSHAGCSIRRPLLNKFFHVCDRTTIYFFIAGSYSPWLMLREIHPSIMWLQWTIWVAATLGTLYTFVFLEKYKLLETILYLLVGLVPGVLSIIWNPSHPTTSCGLSELGLGGSFYILGVIIFKCDGLIPFAHAIWHLFVAAGALSHYYAICKCFYNIY